MWLRAGSMIVTDSVIYAAQPEAILPELWLPLAIQYGRKLAVSSQQSAASKAPHRCLLAVGRHVGGVEPA